MGEFKRKKLKSSSGKKVTKRKQAIAIALNSKTKETEKEKLNGWTDSTNPYSSRSG